MRSLVQRLRGMFAFAIWDAKQQTFAARRDRIGIKPLYVYRDHEKLIFGSELKAILAYPGIDRTIDINALEDYLAFGFISGRRSIFRRVEKLPAAHVLVVSAGQLDVPPQRYWTYPAATVVSRSVDDWKDAIAEKVSETVRSHLLADVPVGAFLSGGVDSSVVVAEASAATTEPLQTFSIGFDQDPASELPYAREVARQVSLPAHGGNCHCRCRPRSG